MIVQSIVFLGLIAFPFIAMPLLWRRMKKVREGAYQGQRGRREPEAWEETVGQQDGLGLGRTNNPNADLTALGSKARESRWPLDNQ